MKSLCSILVVLMAVSAQAKTDYIACTDLRADEYNVLLVIENSQVKSYSTLEDDFKNLQSVDADSKQLDVTYLNEDDTNFSYVIGLTDKLTAEVSIQAMTSGNDADNYDWQPSGAATVCHLLKSQPTNAVIRSENFTNSIPVKH